VIREAESRFFGEAQRKNFPTLIKLPVNAVTVENGFCRVKKIPAQKNST